MTPEWTPLFGVYMHWASQETYQFFRATLTKIPSIKINHIWTQINYCCSYQSHLKKTIACLSPKGVKCCEIARGNYTKITETARLHCMEFGNDKSQYGGLHDSHLKLNEWLLNVLNRWPCVQVLSEQFLWFLKNDSFVMSLHFLLDKSNPLIFQMCFIWNTIAYLCPNMIYFDAVYFSERCSEEVISFLWCSVYISAWNPLIYGVVYGSPCGRPEKVCLFILSWIALRRTGLVLRRTVVMLSWVALKRTEWLDVSDRLTVRHQEWRDAGGAVVLYGAVRTHYIFINIRS